MTNDRINIIIAESAPVIAAGLNHCLRRMPGLQAVVTEAATPSELESLMRNVMPDVIVINPNFGGVFDPKQFRSIHSGDYKLVAVTTGQLASTTLALFDASISVIDDLHKIGEMIGSLTRDEEEDDLSKEQLSQREKEIVALVVKGMTNKDIADKLFLSVYTVQTHRRNIARKLDIHSATGLTIYAIVNNIVDIKELNL